MAFGNQDEEQELFAGAVALLVDLSETLRDLQGCFPQLRDIEAEIFALDLDPAKADQAKSHLDEIVDAVSEYETIVDQSAIYALHTMEGIASEEAPAAVKQKRIAEYALVVRNFISPVARFALDNAFSRGVKKDAAEIWRKARPKFVDGAADGLGSMGRPVAIITVAALVHLIFGPVAGVATAAAGFGKVDRLLKLADKWLEKAEAGDNARSADDELTEEADVDN